MNPVASFFQQVTAGLGGALAAAPGATPPSPVIEPACYLVFTEASGGAFINHWSETPVEGALASFVPEKPVAKFKYTSNGGRSELCRGVGGPNKKAFYKGWASFIRTAYGHKAVFTLIDNLPASPVAIFLCENNSSVFKVDMKSPRKLTGILALAVTHKLATGFNVITMPPRLFISIGEKEGASCPLDGGLTKAEDGLEQRLSSRRISSEQEIPPGSTLLGPAKNGSTVNVGTEAEGDDAEASKPQTATLNRIEAGMRV